MADKKQKGGNGKHAGERFLVTLDKDIHERLVDMAGLEGLGLATKARQILTMYVNGVQHVPVVTTTADNKDKNDNKDSGTTNIFDDDSWANN